MIGKNLLFFCMILCFCGFVQAASNEDAAENADRQMVAGSKILGSENFREYLLSVQEKICIKTMHYASYQSVGFPIPEDVVVWRREEEKSFLVASVDEKFLASLRAYNVLDSGSFQEHLLSLQGKHSLKTMHYASYQNAGFRIPEDVVVWRVEEEKSFLVASADEKFLASLRAYNVLDSENFREHLLSIQEKICIAMMHYASYQNAGFPIPEDAVVWRIEEEKSFLVASADEKFLASLRAYNVLDSKNFQEYLLSCQEKHSLKTMHYARYYQEGFSIPEDVMVWRIEEKKAFFVVSADEKFLASIRTYQAFRGLRSLSLDSEKTVRFFTLPAKWGGVPADKEGNENEYWMALNADLCGLTQCFFEQVAFCDKLTLCSASQRLVFTIDRSVNVVNSGKLCNILVRLEALGVGAGFGSVDISRKSDDQWGDFHCIHPDGAPVTLPFVCEGATPPQVPCCYNFGGNKLTVRSFLYDNVAKKERCLLWFDIDYKDFRKILISKGTSPLDDDALDGKGSGYHFGAFLYHDCLSEYCKDRRTQ